MRTLFLRVLAVLMVLPIGSIVAQGIDIRLHNGNEREVRAEAQLRRVLQEYDLTPWLFTREVLIKSGARPHSHPILTLNTFAVEDDEKQLSTFVHEQIHWFLNADSVRLFATIRDLREMYPEVPVGGREGSGSEFGTYLHLIVNWFELEAMTELVGLEPARQLLGEKGYYTWIYRQVIEDTRKIGTLIRSQGLVIVSQNSE